MASFIGRELLKPSHVMEGAYDASASHAPMGEHALGEGSSDFLGREVDTGTTIMAVAFDGGVILGADSRVSTGVYISNRASDKITAVDEKIYCCRSGSAADTQAVSDYVRYFLDQHRMEYGKAPKVATAASFFQRLCYSNKDMLMAGMICAGWDSVKGGQVYALPIGGALLERPYATGGSGSTYIYGFCDAHYKPGMTKEQCVDFVTRAISHAMARDCSSGGVIRMVVIDEGGVERKFVSGNKLPYGPL